MARLYSSDEARRLAGITYRQLDYWVRKGVVKPEQASAGRGTARRWSAIQVVELGVIAGLLRAGVSMQRVRRAVGWLRNHLPKVKTPLAELSFATDGQRIFYLSPNPGKLVDVLAGGQIVLTIPMEGMGEVAADLHRPRRGSTAEYDLPQRIEMGEDGYFVGRCPALRGCYAQGRTREEAQANLGKAIASYLAVLDEEDADE